MNQSEFLEKVHILLELGKENGGFITEEMLEQPFKEEKLDADQMLSLKSYLSANGVTVGAPETAKKIVKMTAARQTGKMENKEKKIYQSYLEELKLVKTYSEEEEQDLFSRKEAGDDDARMQLVEGNLKKVVEIAGTYAGRGVPLSDLVQEGNMELIMLVDEHSGPGFQEVLKERIGKAMEFLLEEQTGNESFKTRMADMANRLMEVSEEYAEELGEQPTLEELARQLHVDVEEVEAVMKMSMDAMTIDDTGLGGE